MRETQATFKLGIEFVGWDRAGRSLCPPVRHVRRALGGRRFPAPLAARARRRARRRAAAGLFASRSPRAARDALRAARRGPASRSARPTPTPIISTPAFTPRFLRRWARRGASTRIEGKVVDVDRDPASGHVAALTLQVGRERRRRSVHRLLGLPRAADRPDDGTCRWDDWSAVAAVRPRAGGALRPRPSNSRPIPARPRSEAGWHWRIPLQHRTGNGYVFSSRFIGEDEARETLLGALDGAPLAEPRLLRFQAGRRERAWEGNCVAHRAGQRLPRAARIDQHLPDPGGGDRPGQSDADAARGIDPRLAAEFNRLFELHYDRTRDFLVLHYTANARDGEPLWDHVRTMALPDSLAHKIALFRAGAAAPDYQLRPVLARQLAGGADRAGRGAAAAIIRSPIAFRSRCRGQACTICATDRESTPRTMTAACRIHRRLLPGGCRAREAKRGMSPPVNRVVVVGRDAAFGSSASVIAAGAGAGGRHGRRRSSCRARSAPADVYPTLPPLEALHNQLRIDEAALLRRPAAASRSARISSMRAAARRRSSTPMAPWHGDRGQRFLRLLAEGARARARGRRSRISR